MQPVPMCEFTDEENDARLDAGGSNRTDLRAIDVHVHYLPPRYRGLVVGAGISKPDGHVGGVPEWSAEAHLEHMERLGIETSVVSISTPGVEFTGELPDGILAARTANEEGAELVAAHPGRFGFYAALPASDVDAALAELEYADDELGAWGVSLLSNVRGTYIGDPSLEPLWAELSRRSMPVLIHPTQPSNLVEGVMEGWSKSMYEYFFDSTRAIIGLIFSGMLERNPGVKLVVPHAGAALPALARRIERNVWRANRLEPGSHPSFVGSLQNCYFDLAGSVVPYQLPSLLSLIDDTRILAGSDYPFTGHQMGAELMADLRTTELLSPEQKRRILRTNAGAVFPQLAESGVAL